MSENGTNQLPASIQGDGRKFISLLKNYLKDIANELNEQVQKVESYFNVLVDNPDTIDEQVRSITVDEKAVNGSISLLIKWDSTSIKQYAGASIDVKVGDFHDTIDMFDTKEIIRHYDTARTNQFTLDNVEAGKKYWIRVRGRDAKNAMSVAGNAPVALYYIAESKYVPQPPYEATVVFDKRGAYWSWKQYPQNDYEWTELRLDEYVGEIHNRLDLTTDWNSTAVPYARSGTAYLYNKGVGNSYSAPAKIEYSKPIPHAPRDIKITPVFEGLYIEFDVIPEHCFGANVYINNEKHFVQDNKFSFNCSTGNYSIKVCFVDVFGEGEMSKIVQISTIEEIPVEMINKEKLGIVAINKGIEDINKARQQIDTKIGQINTSLTTLNGVIDAKVQDAKDTAESRLTATANTINATVKNNVDRINSSITQVASSIDLKVNAGIDKLTGKEIIARINLTPETVSINGKYVHITGETVFDNGVIVAKYIGDKAVVGTKIADGAITTDKLVSNAITGDKIASNSVTTEKIATNAIESKHIKTNSIDGDKIKAGSITGDRIVAGTISGDKISANTLTGDKIKAGTITGEKVATHSVTADKLQVDSLSAITANLGIVHGGEIIGSTFHNDNWSFSIDANGNIKGANITGATIDANTFRKSGFDIKAMTYEKYKVFNGETCPIPKGFTKDECMFILLYASDFKGADLSPNLGYVYVNNWGLKKIEEVVDYYNSCMYQMPKFERRQDIKHSDDPPEYDELTQFVYYGMTSELKVLCTKYGGDRKKPFLKGLKKHEHTYKEGFLNIGVIGMKR